MRGRSKIISQIKELATSTHNYALLANYIITNTQKVITFRINDLANKTYVSTSTVSRFVKLLGLSGYNEFQHVLKYYLHNIAGDYISHSSPDNKGDYIKTLYKNTTKSLQDTHNIIDTKKIEQVSLYLTKTQEVILIAGQASYVPCLDLAEKLIRLGFNVKFSNNAYIQNTYCKLSTKNSLVIAVSYSGINFEVLRNLKIVKGNNSHIVTVTKRNKNEVNSYSDVALHVLSNESIERYVSLTSHLTLIYLFDAIFVTVLEKYHNKYIHNLRKTKLDYDLK